MKVNDRGTMKWTSLMLPEHIEALNRMWEEQTYKEMPILDEHQIMENNVLLQRVLEYDLRSVLNILRIMIGLFITCLYIK